MNIRYLGFAMALGLSALGCGGDDDADKSAAPLEVIGDWESKFGETTFEETITAEEWNGAAIIEYDNDTNIVITQNPDGDDPITFPNLFSRIVYLDPEDDSFYYCTTDYGLETLEDARAADTEVDETDLDGEGCNGFPWSKLTQK